MSQGKLILQVIEAVVDRRGRKHQDLRLDALLDDTIHQPLIACLPVFEGIVIAEIVRFVDDDEIVVAPVDAVQRHAQRIPAASEQVRVAQNVVTEPILREGVSRQIPFVIAPIIRQLLGAKHEHGPVPQLIVLDDRQRRKRLAEAYAIRKYAPVEGFQLVDDAVGRIALKVEQLLPNQAVLVSGQVIRKDVCADVLQELGEDVVEHQEVDALRRVFLIHRRDVLADKAGDVLELFLVAPNLIEQADVCGGDGRLVHLVDHVRDRVALLVTKVHGGESVERHVHRIGARPFQAGKLLHRGLAAIGAEGRSCAASTQRTPWR